MKPNIVFLDKYSINNVDTTIFSSLGSYTEYDVTDTKEQVLERCLDAEIIITNKVRLKRDILTLLPRLKLVCIAATGVNNIDLDAATELGIEVRNVSGYGSHSVAESTICGVLSLMKQIAYYDNFVKSEEYAKSKYLFHFGRPTSELYGKRWGVIGLGNIGRHVAKLAQAFGCEVFYASTSSVVRKEEFELLELNELLKSCDIVSIHTPLNEKTRNLIDEPQLKLMKSNAIIVNVARGTIINEQALTNALDEEIIAGCYLDVYSREPILTDNPLLKLKDPLKAIMTPHSSWATKEALNKLVAMVAENIKTYLK